MISLKTVAYADGTPIPTEMIFEGQDPYTVVFVFHHGGEAVKWTFAKELLDDLENNDNTGDGDVQFELDEGTHKLSMAICSPEGFLVLEFDPCAVDEFLEEVNYSPEFAHATMEITDDEIYGWLEDEAA
jgi:hypothetical protein